MSKYMKAFVFAALFYLGLAAIFGILNGTTDIGYFGSFAHTHFNLLGFMAMIVFGIGYFILPRFNGTELRFENWVPIHFYLGNISLLGMVIFRGLQVETGSDIYTGLFIASASLQVFSIFMFITNIWMTLTPKKKTAEILTPIEKIETTHQVDESTMPNMSVTPDTKVSDLVDRLPSLQDVLVECGLLALQMPGHIDKVRQMGITIEMAANNHSIDLDNMIVKIEEELQKNGFTTKPNLDKYNVSHSSTDSEGLNLNILIGDVIKQYPASKDTFQKYFGDGCFDCPGQEYESIDMACRMHSVDPDLFLKELKEALA
jgi:hybrid cluster-associated redox disulfide protein